MRQRSFAVVALSLIAYPFLLCAQQVAPARHEVYIVPFSHLDLYWAGTQEECLSRGNRIISKAIGLAERYRDFRFLLEDDDFVADFVDGHRGTPELESFRRLVKAGRIEIAPKWAAIYQNLPRGEALVRNVVLGKRYARDVFGVDPQVAQLGDIPGFTRQYPQILRKADTPYMVMTRMGPPDRSLFNWKAPDGSAILVWNTIKGYGWGADLGLHLDMDDARLAAIASDLDNVQTTTASPVYMGWGTDLWTPSEKLIENVTVLNQRLAPRHFRFATPDEFFRDTANSPEIPELSGEIPSSWANLTTSLSPLWPPVMAATDTLLNAEKFAAINDALGYAPYPGAEFDSLWKDALKSMDHNNDGQGGVAGDERKLGYAQGVSLRAGQILRDSLRNIAERVQHPSPRSTPIVVFNPLSWTRDDIVKTHVTLFGDIESNDIEDYRKGMRLLDEKGISIPFQVEESSEWFSRAVDLVFIDRGVPSLGYKTYYLVPADKPDLFLNACQTKLESDSDLNQSTRIMGSDVMENEYYRVSVDRATGGVKIWDKELNRVVAHDIEIAASEERGGDDLSIIPPTGRAIVNVIDRVDLEENNSVQAVMLISGNIAGVPVVQRITLYQGLKRVDFEDRVDWKPGRSMNIEQVFPLPPSNMEVRTGTPFGSVTAADMMPNAGPRNSDEVPKDTWKRWRQIQDWVFAGAEDWGFTLSADHQFLTVGDNALRAGMLRGTRFSPVNFMRSGRSILKPPPPDGTYVFHYSFASARGDWATAKSWRAGMAFNSPLIPVTSANELSQKPLPATRSFCFLDADNLIVTALKKADRDDSIVMRVFEIRGDGAKSPVQFLGQNRKLSVVNLLEEAGPGQEGDMLLVGPYEISTVKLRLAEPAKEMGYRRRR
jgi:alpha-mannosidase